MKVWKNLISFVIPKERCEGVNEKARKICDSKLYYARKAGRWCLQLRRIGSGDISTETIIEHLVKKFLHFSQEARKLFHQPSYLQNQSAYSQFLLALSSHFCASARVFWCAAHPLLPLDDGRAGGAPRRDRPPARVHALVLILGLLLTRFQDLKWQFITRNIASPITTLGWFMYNF